METEYFSKTVDVNEMVTIYDDVKSIKLNWQPLDRHFCKSTFWGTHRT